MFAESVTTLERGTADGQFVCVDAVDLLHGCVRVTQEGGGWQRPWRFSSGQVRTMGSCLAWHPGLYRQMARTTAGITLEFNTDSTEVAVEVLLDSEPTGTAAVLDPIRGEEDLPLDGLSADVDGRHLACTMPDEREAVVWFSLDDPDDAPLPGLMMLPGMGDVRHVRVWLPALRGCAVRRVWGNGSSLEAVEQRPQLLVIGDSIAQGFVTGDSALSWPALLAGHLGLDLVNQGLGGQVFQQGTLLGLASLVNPQMVVVALGANYRYEPCRHRATARDVRSYLMEVSRLWPDIPTYVCTPLWHDEEAYPSHAMSCWQRIPSMIAANAAVHDQMTLVDGLRLMDHDPAVLADGYEHPNAEGARQVAQRLWMRMGLDATPSDEELRARALDLLKDAPFSAFPLVEALRRGIGRVRLAQDGCVLLDVGTGEYLAYADTQEAGTAALAMLDDARVVTLLQPALAEQASRLLGLTVRMPFQTAVYKRKTRTKVPAHKDVRVLDESYVQQIMDHYSHPKFMQPDQLAKALRQGWFLGGFEDDQLVGYIGEHPEGAMGLLEVFEGYRRKGWGRALEAAKINQVLDRGQVPWAEAFPQNEAMVALQRKLGMVVSPADEQVLLWLPEEEPADEAEGEDGPRPFSVQAFGYHGLAT